MDVSFVNKYTVSKEGHQPFHISPTRRGAPSSAAPETNRSTPRSAKIGSAVRILGLCVAIIIVVFTALAGMWPFVIVGAILVAIYVLRIWQTHERKVEQREASVVPPPSPSYTASGKWTRYVRFGDHIEVEDPGLKHEYQYAQIERISDDGLYITLWMDSDRQVRVYTRGFIIGNLEGFRQFIMAKTGRMIGPGSTDAAEGEDQQ